MGETRRIKDGERVGWTDADGRFRRGHVKAHHPQTRTYDCRVLPGWRYGMAKRQTVQEVPAEHLEAANPLAKRTPEAPHE